MSLTCCVLIGLCVLLAAVVIMNKLSASEYELNDWCVMWQVTKSVDKRLAANISRTSGGGVLMQQVRPHHMEVRYELYFRLKKQL